MDGSLGQGGPERHRRATAGHDLLGVQRIPARRKLDDANIPVGRREGRDEDILADLADTLSASPPGNVPAHAKGLSYTFPTGVELMGDNTQFAMPPDPNGSLTWTSAPVDDDLAILGRVQVQFYAASENPDTDFESICTTSIPTVTFNTCSAASCARHCAPSTRRYPRPIMWRTVMQAGLSRPGPRSMKYSSRCRRWEPCCAKAIGCSS